MKIKINENDKSKVLAALYNRSKPLGLGMLYFTPEDMTESEAENLLKDNKYKYFDYLQGRVMKIDLAGDTVDFWLYDRDNGNEAGKRALEVYNIEFEIIAG